ncbi:putative extracellular lipase [Trichodelitschia bisporula]|uniref:Carboxylic ester hydrolase n=1 Tax=Trichodelitschia bisporula TaxID=703511 RepID=A0A6G1HZX5_9PEZI|nr:putative extracellular lipase [Trichodelitschia bisporula]
MHSITSLILLAFALTLPAAALVTRQANASTITSVTYAHGTVLGLTLGLTETFKGIPFAEPPVGPLRLRPPVPISRNLGTFASDPSPRACPQFSSQVDTKSLPAEVASLYKSTPFGQVIANAGEDCLTLSIQRPAGTRSSAKLPVVFWLYGGAFATGSTNSYDATSLLTRAKALKQPVLFVAANYRLGGFGFLPGAAVSRAGASNLGLRDQRAALEWVQDNIASFGGDPDRVVIWGESAGALSVFDHTVINGGDHTRNGKALFRGAIMNSGAVAPTQNVSHPKPQAVYDSVLRAAGCAKAVDGLECLRGLSYGAFVNAVDSVPAVFSYRSVDLAYLPRPDPADGFYNVSPEVAIVEGRYARVPIIVGDQQDEGTLFTLTLSNVTTTSKLEAYLASMFWDATPAQIAALVKTYPRDPGAGSPYNTALTNEIYPGFKRVAAILGDLTFTLSRRVYLAAVANNIPAWSYLSTYLYGTAVLGTFHGSDILELFYGGIPWPLPAAAMETYYISFINHLDPNAIRDGLIDWPRYTPEGRKLMNFQQALSAVIKDDFREDSYRQLAQSPQSFRL